MAADQTWDTALLPEPERLPFWREVVWNAFTPVSVTSPAVGPFSGSVCAGSAGPLQVATIASQPQSVARTAAHIARDPGDVYFLNLPLSQGATARQAGRVAQLEPGDFVVLDSARPFALDFAAPFRQVSVTIPHDILTPALGEASDVTAITVSGRSGVGAVAAASVRALATPGDVSGREGRELAACLARLLSLAITEEPPPRRVTERRRLRQAVLDAAERDLADPALSPAQVAARVGVSVRHLHQLFAGTGATFGQRLLQRRLQLCHRDLSDPAFAEWTIAEVAARHGLADPAHFSRAFKARYGRAPRDLRRKPAPGDPAPTG